MQTGHNGIDMTRYETELNSIFCCVICWIIENNNFACVAPFLFTRSVDRRCYSFHFSRTCSVCVCCMFLVRIQSLHNAAMLIYAYYDIFIHKLPAKQPVQHYRSQWWCYFIWWQLLFVYVALCFHLSWDAWLLPLCVLKTPTLNYRLELCSMPVIKRKKLYENKRDDAKKTHEWQYLLRRSTQCVCALDLTFWEWATFSVEMWLLKVFCAKNEIRLTFSLWSKRNDENIYYLVHSWFCGQLVVIDISY